MSLPITPSTTRPFVTSAARGRTEAVWATAVTMLLLLWSIAAGPNSRVTAQYTTRALAGASAAGTTHGTSSETLEEPSNSVDRSRLQTPNPAVTALSDEQLEQRLLGRWQSSYHGTQQIATHADFTAQLRIDFDWLATFFYGNQMRLELAWSVENGVLTNRIEGGQPQANVDRLIADYSDSCSYLILELTESTLLLQEVDDPAAFHRWNRLED
ncbi:MAG: hypothetical protein ACK5Q5_01330 [Planctomycetaceae bacterium]